MGYAQIVYWVIHHDVHAQLWRWFFKEPWFMIHVKIFGLWDSLDLHNAMQWLNYILWQLDYNLHTTKKLKATLLKMIFQSMDLQYILWFKIHYKTKALAWMVLQLIHAILTTQLKTKIHLLQTCQPLEIQTCILKPTNLYFSIKTCIF